MSEIKKCSECQFWVKETTKCFVEPEAHFRGGNSPPCAFIYEWMEKREGGVEVTVLPGCDPVFLTEGDA